MASQPGSTGPSDGGDGRSTQWPLPSSRSGSATCFSLGAGGELTEMFVYTDGQGLRNGCGGLGLRGSAEKAQEWMGFRHLARISLGVLPRRTR